MLSCAHGFLCPDRGSLLPGRTVKEIGARPVVRTAQAPGGRSRVQDDIDDVGDGEGFDGETSVAAAPAVPREKPAEPAARKTNRLSRRARRVLALIVGIGSQRRKVPSSFLQCLVVKKK